MRKLVYIIWLLHLCIKIRPVVLSSESHKEAQYEKCSSILTPNFGTCPKQLKPPAHVHEGFCSHAKVCHKRLHITRMEIEPFVKMLDVIVEHVMGVCCGPCRNPTSFEHVRNTQIQLLNRTILNTSNIVYPVLGVGHATRIYGYHYIPLIKLSSGYYVSIAATPAETMERLINSCLNLWPLLVVMLLLALIAGFVVWSTDTWTNSEDFPRKFFVGVYEGFWWAFVSMTTVGYGDKTPKFIASRIFALLWILIGITICSMFTASLTNEISSASNPPPPVMHGKHVGVLKYRTFDAASVAKLGGVTKETSGKEQEEDFVELKEMLTKGEGNVTGVYLDKYTFMYVVKHALELKHAGDPAGAQTAEFFLKKTTHTQLAYNGEQMSYGLLIREEEDYGYLHEFIEDNHAVYESCISLRLNAQNVLHDSGDSHNLFHPDGGAFYPTLTVTLIIVGLMIVFGVVFELFRTRHNRIANAGSNEGGAESKSPAVKLVHVRSENENSCDTLTTHVNSS